jgi:protein-tyrosine-phosphatase
LNQEFEDMAETDTATLRHARQLARTVRHTPDRLLHRWRHRRQAAALDGLRPSTILFVCLGNICRSPYAAESFQRAAGGKVLAVSAGFIGPGRPVPETGQRVARRRGLDLSQHRSQFITKELVDAADLIVVMDQGQRRGIEQRFGRRAGVVVLGDLDPDPIDTRTVRDPYNQREDVFEAVYARIDRAVSTLARALRLRHTTPAP